MFAVCCFVFGHCCLCHVIVWSVGALVLVVRCSLLFVVRRCWLLFVVCC